MAAFRDVVEALLVGPFGTVLISGAQAFYLNMVFLPDVLVHALVEFVDGWEPCGDGVSRPYLAGRNAVEGQVSGEDDVQHLQTVLSAGYAGYISWHFFLFLLSTKANWPGTRQEQQSCAWTYAYRVAGP